MFRAIVPPHTKLLYPVFVSFKNYHLFLRTPSFHVFVSFLNYHSISTLPALGEDPIGVLPLDPSPGVSEIEISSEIIDDALLSCF